MPTAVCHPESTGSKADLFQDRKVDMKAGFVYILANNNLTLYIGVTSDLAKRIYQHKQGLIKGFTQKYKLHKLVYFEIYSSIVDAIAREKQLKNWHRAWKLNLIKTQNLNFEDLFPKVMFSNQP